MFKKILSLLFLVFGVIFNAYAVTCQSNEFEYNGECIESKFEITTTNDTNKFVFNMSAKGTFYIDWGDGNVQMINRTGTTMTEYSHNYASANEYIIKFGGLATGYSTSSLMPAVLFGIPADINDSVGGKDSSTNNTASNIATISGTLGEIFPIIGAGGTYATAPSFFSTFRRCINLTTIPPELFGRIKNGQYVGLNGKPCFGMFRNTFGYCTGLTGTNIDDPDQAGYKFAVPDTLFGRYLNNTYYGVTGSSTGLFRSLFTGCTNMTGTIPKDLFAGLSGMLGGIFYMTFYNCSGLTGQIPEDLFGREINSQYFGLNGTSGYDLFFSAFRNCSGLTGPIPEKLFGRTINGIKYGVKASTGTTFSNMFRGCSGLTGTYIDDPDNPGMKYAIHPNLFSTLNTKPTQSLFGSTFQDCSGLTGTIPGNLFRGVSGAPAQTMFNSTFSGCSGLTGSIPENLFSGISGAPAPNMFYGTFDGCSGLTGSIPGNLFSGISGKPYGAIFQYTFYNCSGLTGTNIDDPNNPGKKYAIPPTLFSGISGSSGGSAPFGQTFAGCTGLSGTIPGTLFGGLSGTPVENMFNQTFLNCSGLTGSIPGDLFSGISGTPAASMFYQTFSGCSGLTGSIPGDLFVGISGSPATSMFNATFYKCSGLTGTDIDDPNNPGMKYAIPPTLFSGISGAPAQSMFTGTFSNCSSLNGTIPSNLFSGISGAPAANMFNNTFNSCYYLQGTIPSTLFSGVHGAPAKSMFNGVFYSCGKLVGAIPADLFAGIVGKPATNMFYRTFYNCTNLGKDTIGGTSKYYVPPELFAGIDKTLTAENQMFYVFASTGLRTTCPTGTTDYTTGFETYFSGKKSCTACPVEYPLYDSTNDTCYAQVTFIDSDNNTLLKKEDVYYDGNNGSGYNLPSYSPVKPDTILTNWENGSGTVIAANDVLTGNQVVYSDWGFHCDSGKYFHLGNSSQICAAETKRTDHALVINVDPEHTYYIHATPNSEHDYTINSSSIHKLKANYNGTIYNLHDASVYFDN